MAYDYPIIFKGLKFLCGEGDDDICRLCLTSTAGETLVNIGDSYVTKRPYYEDAATYHDMLEELGVSTDDSLPENLCNICSETVTNAYLFRRLCIYSNNKWTEVINKLNSSLDLTKTVSPNVKSVYLLLYNDTIFTSRKNGSKLKKDVLHKFQNIVKSRQNYAKAKSKHSKYVKCTECGKQFKSNGQLLKHNLKVHNKTKNPCPQCFKIFSTPAQLECHEERVHYSKKIQCPKCDKMFSTQRMLKYHDKSQHIAAICKLCCVQFPSKQLLRAHLDKHDVNKCPRCDKNFTNIHTYKAHLKLCGNSEQRRPRFFCDICKKGYVHKNGVRSHLKTDHGFGNVLTCKYCEKKYDAVSKLKNHMVKHTRERNFYCDQCGNQFVTQAALVYHVRLHTGEKPFPCDLCDESFLSASRRMEHKRRKHFGPTILCPLCPSASVHSLSHHGGDGILRGELLLTGNTSLAASDRMDARASAHVDSVKCVTFGRDEILFSTQFLNVVQSTDSLLFGKMNFKRVVCLGLEGLL